ncbi:hypothetical protein K439DRAFT_725375 [Ramaria rubella]|nr:hypothetical protein K439DRAFT_725375 [Ramaria rubella]
MGRFGLPSKAKKGKAPVASRKRDTPDPTLVIEGQCTRKPTACATAGHASVDSVEMLGDDTAHQLSPHQEEVDSDYSNDIHNSGVDANTVDPDNEPDEIFDGIPEAAPTVPRARKKTSKAVKNKVLDAKKEAETAELLAYIRFRVPFKNASSQDVVNIIKVSVNETEDKARQAVYVIIGCEGLSQSMLPELVCRLSKDVKAHKVVLNDSGWEHLKTHWPLEVRRKASHRFSKYPSTQTSSFSRT